MGNGNFPQREEWLDFIGSGLWFLKIILLIVAWTAEGTATTQELRGNFLSDFIFSPMK